MEIEWWIFQIKSDEMQNSLLYTQFDKDKFGHADADHDGRVSRFEYHPSHGPQLSCLLSLSHGTGIVVTSCAPDTSSVCTLMIGLNERCADCVLILFRYLVSMLIKMDKVESEEIEEIMER